MTTPNFTRSISIQELIDNFNGNARVSYKVKGYWSADTITVYVRKDFIGTTRGNGIVVNVSHSSGGRDTDEVKQDFEAVQYFAEALNDASKVAEFLFNESDALVHSYDRYCEELLAEDARQREAVAAKIAADTLVGDKEAKKLVERVVKEVTISGSDVTIMARKRGFDSLSTFKLKAGQRISFYTQDRYGNMTKINRKEFTQAIAETAEVI